MRGEATSATCAGAGTLAVSPARRWLLLFALTAGAEAILLGLLATHVGVNADEGFYVSAGARVLAGRRLYADFFFPQMPYLPYVEAGVLAICGPSLLATRAISVTAAALVAGMLAVAGARWSGSTRVGVVLAAVYGANALVLHYLSIVKTYGLSNLALVAAFLLLAAPRAGLAQMLAAGACAGVAVGTRLPAAAALVVMLLWSARRGRRHLLAFAAGALLASLPWLWAALRAPQAFWFCNFGFHALRREISGVGPILSQKAVVLAKWVLLPQNLVLWLLAGAGLRRDRTRGLPAAACVAALAVVYLAATPTYLDYLLQIVPFLLIAAIPAIAALQSRRALAVVAAGVYAIGLVAARRAAPEESPRGMKARMWQLSTVQTVAGYLHDHSEPGDHILSWWEGYPVLAGRHGYIGVGFWESNVAKKLSPAARQQYHILGREDLERLVAAQDPRLIVAADGTWSRLKAVIDAQYQPAARFGAVRVFERRAPKVASRPDPSA